LEDNRREHREKVDAFKKEYASKQAQNALERQAQAAKDAEQNAAIATAPVPLLPASTPAEAPSSLAIKDEPLQPMPSSDVPLQPMSGQGFAGPLEEK